jgi:hypothetical protein
VPATESVISVQPVGAVSAVVVPARTVSAATNRSPVWVPVDRLTARLVAPDPLVVAADAVAHRVGVAGVDPGAVAVRDTSRLPRSRW